MNRLSLVFLITVILAGFSASAAESKVAATTLKKPDCAPTILDLSGQRMKKDGGEVEDGSQLLLDGVGRDGSIGPYTQRMIYQLKNAKPLTGGNVVVTAFSRLHREGVELTPYFAFDPEKATLALKPQGYKAFLEFTKANEELVITLSLATAGYEHIYSYDHVVRYTGNCP